jgi:hypothetical protein
MRVARTNWPSVTRLRDGRVLVSGGRIGRGADSYTAASEIYDPVANTWTDAAPLPEAGTQVQTALLADGRVLAAGGFASHYGTVWSTKSEIYDPATDAWTATGALPARAGTGAHMVLLQDGRALLVNASVDDDTYQTSAETFDPATGAWTATPAMTSSHFEGAVALLGDGDVVVAGGERPQAPTEIYHLTTVADEPLAPVTPPTPQVNKPAPPKVASDPAAAPRFPKGLKTLKVGKSGKVTVKLSCSPGLGSCHGTLKLTTRGKHPRTLARAAFATTPGRAKTVTLKLSSSVRRQLRRHHTLKAQLTLGTHKVAVTVRGS